MMDTLLVAFLAFCIIICQFCFHVRAELRREERERKARERR